MQRSAAEAGQDFRALKQGAMDVQELYQQLKVPVAQQLTYPDPYTLSHRFMEALNPKLSAMIMGKGYAAETDTVDQLVHIAEF